MATTELQAGRALDARVAIRLFDYHMVHCRDSEGGWRRSLPAYSTNIAAAWQVVERVRALGFGVTISDGDEWSVGIAPNNHDADVTVEFGDSAPLAICRAALAAVSSPNTTGGGDG
jgi:hypothetical protein